MPVEALAAHGAEALAAQRFKDPIEHYKLAIRQDVQPQPRPEWRAALDQACVGRARTLAAKGMVKEAAMVWKTPSPPMGRSTTPRSMSSA